MTAKWAIARSEGIRCCSSLVLQRFAVGGQGREWHVFRFSRPLRGFLIPVHSVAIRWSFFARSYFSASLMCCLCYLPDIRGPPWTVPGAGIGSFAGASLPSSSGASRRWSTSSLFWYVFGWCLGEERGIVSRLEPPARLVSRRVYQDPCF